MKKIVKLLSIVLSLFILQQNVFAQNDNNKKYEFVKNKAVNKSYTVSSSDKLTIQNSFGDVQVHTWAKNEIKIDVTVEVSANSEAVAQRIIDGINVADSKSGGDISFKTSIKGANTSKNEKTTMKVNYEISMPSSNPLNITNEFGAIVLSDFKGEVELTSKFGSLTTGTLSNVKRVSVEFGKAKIESVSNGVINGEFSSLEIGNLSGKIELLLELCKPIKINIDKSLTSLDASISYSTLNIKPVDGLSATYTLFDSFGSLINRSNIKFEIAENNKEKKFATACADR